MNKKVEGFKLVNVHKFTVIGVIKLDFINGNYPLYLK